MDAMNTTGSRVAELTTNLAAVRARLAHAAEAAGRAVEEIRLLPVTKFFPAADAAILWRRGCRDFGESRSQEAATKVAEFDAIVGASDPPARWHMIGQIQRNKANQIAAWADTVHSVGVEKVAEALGSAAAQALTEGRRDRPLRIFVQISLDGDTTRGGVDLGDPAAVDPSSSAGPPAAPAASALPRAGPARRRGRPAEPGGSVRSPAGSGR
jgi:uncharacterized pyridoxal phosphate-containing UPF0001 family protein